MRYQHHLESLLNEMSFLSTVYNNYFTITIT